jgi:hypothetical protein
LSNKEIPYGKIGDGDNDSDDDSENSDNSTNGFDEEDSLEDYLVSKNFLQDLESKNVSKQLPEQVSVTVPDDVVEV